MGRQRLTAIRIDEDDLKKAKNLGINVSQVCRNAVKEAIRRMDGISGSKDPGIYREPYSEGGRGTVGYRVVGLPGFEPGSREPESRSLNQTSRGVLEG